MTMSRFSPAVLLEPAEENCPLPAIVDCTAPPRFGVRGRGGCRWLRSEGFPVPAVNAADIMDDGTLVLRIGEEDTMIGGAAGESRVVSGAEARWAVAETPRGYDAFRRDGWAHLAIAGSGASELMAQITETDLRPSSLPAGRISQTRALHMDAVIVRTDRFGEGGYELFFDIASRVYAIGALRALEPQLAVLSVEEFLALRPASGG